MEAVTVSAHLDDWLTGSRPILSMCDRLRRDNEVIEIDILIFPCTPVGVISTVVPNEADVIYLQ